MKKANVNSQWQQSWTALRPGQPVRLRQGQAESITGVLDTRTDDCSVVWIYLSDGAGRRLIHRDDGYSIVRAGE